MHLRRARSGRSVLFQRQLGCGIAQLRGSSTSKISPYRGWFYWHHIAGLLFGIVTMTWAFSGLLSMNPWGFLEGRRGG